MSSQSLANDIYFYMRFLYNFGVAICKYHAVQDLYIHSISAENFILQIFVKMLECHVETVFCSKVAGFEGGLFQKRIAIQTICQLNKLKKKCSVCLCHYL